MSTTEETALIRPPQQDTELSVEQIVERMEKVRDLMKRAMVEGVDYGVIPGTDGKKKPLLQPGAEKLAMMFRLAASYKIVQNDLPDGHREFSVTCRLTHIPSDNFCGEATASCSSLETKYRYRGGARKCPHCGKETIKKSKYPPRNQPNGQPGFYCYGKVGGCGAEFDFDDKDIVNQSEVKTENPDIAGEFNTIVQMAQKRAFLRAIRQATASSELFTQDVGEGGHDDDDRRPHDQGSARDQRRQAASGEENQDTPPQHRQQPKAELSKEALALRNILHQIGVPAGDVPFANAVIAYGYSGANWAACVRDATLADKVAEGLIERGSHGLSSEEVCDAARAAAGLPAIERTPKEEKPAEEIPY